MGSPTRPASARSPGARWRRGRLLPGRGARPPQGSYWEAEARARTPLSASPGDIEAVREALYQVMWDDVGILRDAKGLARARSRLGELHAGLARTGVSGADLRYNLSWHDWLNLESLITVS